MVKNMSSTCSNFIETSANYASAGTYRSKDEIATNSHHNKPELFRTTTDKTEVKLFASSKSIERKKSIRELNKKASLWK